MCEIVRAAIAEGKLTVTDSNEMVSVTKIPLSILDNIDCPGDEK